MVTDDVKYDKTMESSLGIKSTFKTRAEEFNVNDAIHR